jgi:hypothetical protein
METVDCCWNCGFGNFVIEQFIYGTCTNPDSPYYDKDIQPDNNCKHNGACI